jgi:hypothetical protein
VIIDKMNILKTEEYSRSLPNSRWLRNMLEYKKEICEGIVSDKEWIKREKSLGRKVNLKYEKIDLKMSTKILEQEGLIMSTFQIFVFLLSHHP